jgi:hypothetical protein
MGRGLSTEQKWILAEAGRLRLVFYVDILTGFYGWQPDWPIERYQKGDLTYTDELVPEEWYGQAKFPGTQYFSRLQIGEKTYAKTMAALSRACARLEARGLVRRFDWRRKGFAGLQITAKGREYLSVNSHLNQDGAPSAKSTKQLRVNRKRFRRRRPAAGQEDTETKGGMRCSSARRVEVARQIEKATRRKVALVR